MPRAFCAVALLALVCLLVRGARVGLAGDYVDPISHIATQDEALYGHTAIAMAQSGDWLTPHFMGRLALYKPPLLIWFSAASARILGVSRLSLRLPIALLCALATGLIFLFAAELATWQSGVCAAILLSSNHVWHVLGGSCMTDGVLVALYVAAMYCLFSDPWLASRRCFWGFSAAVAGAILTKSIAGILPLGVLGLYWLSAPAKYKPAFLRVCMAGLLALALASPWFIYELAVHGRWFLAEHIGIEILGYGAGPAPQTSLENHALFYVIRMALTDPVLLAATLVAIPAFFIALRKRSHEATLLLCWVVVVAASVAVWQYRNASYLLPLVPALAIIGSSYGPFGNMRPGWWMVALAAAAFVLKAGAPSSPAGISFAGGTVQPLSPAVSSYCLRDRGNELILVGMDDDLYASVLPLARLRYALLQAPSSDSRFFMDFASMGIILDTGQFNHLAQYEPGFRRQLHDWGIDSAAPIGTLIIARSVAELSSMVQAHPESDFLIPERYRAAAAGDTAHMLVDAVPGHFFLLSRTPIPGPVQKWSCSL
jgi:hypothetical protein